MFLELFCFSIFFCEIFLWSDHIMKRSFPGSFEDMNDFSGTKQFQKTEVGKFWVPNSPILTFYRIIQCFLTRYHARKVVSDHSTSCETNWNDCSEMAWWSYNNYILIGAKYRVTLSSHVNTGRDDFNRVVLRHVHPFRTLTTISRVSQISKSEIWDSSRGGGGASRQFCCNLEYQPPPKVKFYLPAPPKVRFPLPTSAKGKNSYLQLYCEANERISI